jgi:hypothetical protein
MTRFIFVSEVIWADDGVKEWAGVHVGYQQGGGRTPAFGHTAIMATISIWQRRAEGSLADLIKPIVSLAS